MLFCQSIDLVITIDTFYWLLLSKSPLSQSEASLNKSRSALLECAIHNFNGVFPFCCRGDIVKEIRILETISTISTKLSDREMFPREQKPITVLNCAATTVFSDDESF